MKECDLHKGQKNAWSQDYDLISLTMIRDKQKPQHANHHLAFIVVLDILLDPLHN